MVGAGPCCPREELPPEERSRARSLRHPKARWLCLRYRRDYYLRLILHHCSTKLGGLEAGCRHLRHLSRAMSREAELNHRRHYSLALAQEPGSVEVYPRRPCLQMEANNNRFHHRRYRLRRHHRSIRHR